MEVEEQIKVKLVKKWKLKDYSRESKELKILIMYKKVLNKG